MSTEPRKVRATRVSPLMTISEDLRVKAELMYGTAGAGTMIRAAAADGGSAVLLFRFSQFLLKMHLSPCAWLITKLNKMLNGITIGVTADIAPGFVIQHSVGVVINGNAVLGRGCILEGGVVIGSVDRKNPVLESGVYLGSGAKVIGGVRVGADTKVGANAVVVKDLEPGSVAVGIPARAVRPSDSANE